jgi:acetoin utilization deacetylase AcuC-like enzyme
MKIITNSSCTEYSHPGHPERPGRISGTVTRLQSQTALQLQWELPGNVPEESLLRAHTPEHLERLEESEDFDPDTPFYPGIRGFAESSTAAALQAMRSARAGVPAFSLMRPPGHHATASRAMGFCYLNNIAVAALEALATGTSRIAVFDFDVHHGNGTEAILLNHAAVEFHSVHQHPCYPGTGTRKAGSNCFNYPMPPQAHRAEYREALSSALEHLAKFKPELIGVSAGFDSYARDPLAQQMLEAEDYHWLGHQLRKLNTPIFSVLEGGYSTELPELVLAYLTGLAE